MKIPYLQVRNDRLIYYEIAEFRTRRNNVLPTTKAYSGQMTTGSKKRIKKAIDILVQKSPQKIIWNSVSGKHQPFTLNFVTLTVSCMRNISANEAYKNLMKPFLRKMRKMGGFSYIWKAELQKRGQIHYHLATNTFLPWQSIRDSWNNLQRKSGYLKQYGLKHGHYQANSTDVHAVYSIGNLPAYLGKYMSNNDDTAISGKTWDCSKDCKENRFAFSPDSGTIDRIEKGIQQGTIQQIDLEHCVIFKMADPIGVLPISSYKKYLQWRS